MRNGERTIVKRLVPLVVASVLASGVGSVLTAASAAAAENAIDFGAGATSATFGPNATVRIDGRITFEDECSEDGFGDFVYPATDVYVVSEEVRDGSQLSDAGGAGPNTIVSTATLFIGEVIAITAPGGSLGAGTYGVVYDTCQDGTFDGGLDAFFPGAITIALPPVLPPVAPAIQDLKGKARVEWLKWVAMHFAMERIFELAGDATEAQCEAGSPLACAYGKIDPLGHISESFLTLLLNQANHYLGIADDPPDGDFSRLTTLDPVSVPSAHTGEAVPDAVSDALAPLAGEAALNRALLRSLERYQGAQVAGDEEWALAHARQARDLAATLSQHLPSTTSAMASLRAAIASEVAVVDRAVADAWEYYKRVVRSGFTPDERRVLANQGRSGQEITALETSVRNLQLTAHPHGALEALEAAITAHGLTGTALDEAVGGLDAIVTNLEAQRSVPQVAPVARAGGPYTVREGDALVLDGSGSTAPLAGTLTGFAWDLDGDGDFDDASGPQPTVSYPTQGARLIGLRVTASSGRQSVSYATAAVADANAAPTLSSSTPDVTATRVVVGAPETFSLAAADPEGGAVSYAWAVDGAPAGAATATFTYDPPASAVGQHRIEVTVSDGTVAGGTTRRSWDVFVILSDGDGDGWTQTTDCNDADFSVHPGANELLGNDIDDDCDQGTPDAPPGGLTGSMWAWGDNRGGQVGIGSTAAIIASPARIPGYDDVVQVDTGFGTGYAVRDSGEVLAWGRGGSGNLGNGENMTRNVPVSPLPVGGGSGQLSGVTQLAAGVQNGHVLARRTDGTVVAWGDNFQRKLGDGSTVIQRNVPVPVLTAPDGPPLAGVRKVEAGGNQSYALMPDGTVRAWGLVQCNGGTQLGGIVEPFPISLPLVGGGVRQIAAGLQMTYILKTDGTVLSCGAGGAFGRTLVPRDTSPDRFKPLPVTGFGPGSGVIEVSSGSSAGLALKADGTVWAWGYNSNGELSVLGAPTCHPGTFPPVGDPCWIATPRQVPLPPGPPVVAIDQDNACHALALRADGSVLSWGCDSFGQVGDGTSGGIVSTPVVVNLPGQAAVSVSNSPWNSLVLTRPLDDPVWERPATWVEASVADATVAEAGGGEFEVTLSAALPHDVTVEWALAAGTAEQSDLPLSGGTVTVPAGATTAPIPVSVTDDTTDEDDETFTVILNDASHGIRLNRPQATGTISDDDAPPWMSVQAVRVAEGHTSLTDAQVSVTLSVPSAKTITATYSTSDGSAAAPADYGATTGNLHIAPGQTTGTIHLPVHGDTAVEAEESFTVTLSDPENATLGSASAAVTIVDDEPLVLNISSPRVTEGTGGTTPATFGVSLDPPAPAGTQVSVPYRLAGLTAAVPADVAPASGTLSFGPGEGPKEVTVAVAADNLSEPNEMFRLLLDPPEVSGERPVLAGDNTPAVIVDDDPTNRPPSCSAVVADPSSLWPANHKLVTVTLGGATDPDRDPVTLTVTAVTQDEPINGLGDGDAAPDAQLGPASDQVQLRAERAGTGDGRIYRLAVRAKDPHGASCTAVATVGVAHDQKAPPLDSGGSFNSLAP